MSFRTLEFTTPSGAVGHVPLEPLLKAFFAKLSPDNPLPRDAKWLDDRAYNWGTDEAYWTARGDGIRISMRHFGAIPGDGIDIIYDLTVGDAVSMSVTLGQDYTQSTFVFELSATPETMDHATDVLLVLAAERGLVLVRRSE